MRLFNPTALERAQRCLGLAQKAAAEAQKHCTLARVALEDSGRMTQAGAIGMICASLSQSESDIVRWSELAGKTRENGL